jgi:RNA polymerase sigma-70 factor (ECF subfamily)
LLTLRRKKKLSDEELVQIIVANNSHEDFGLIYDRYSEKVFHKCISFVKDLDEARDLTHDIFLKTFLNLSKFSFKSKFSTWLYSITYNFCVDYMRKNNRIQTVSEEVLPEITVDESDRHEEELMQIESQRLMVVLNEIPTNDKMILLMKYQDELTLIEIMEVLSINESVVKMRLKRARAKAVLTYKTKYSDER